jgi:TRAP-type transport system periplasmic protein
MKRALKITAVVGLTWWSAGMVAAQEVTLRAITAFAEGSWGSKNFERFIEKVNNEGKGLLRINYVGGPRAMPPFEVGNAVRTRVVDVANVPGSFYTNLLPESDSLKLATKSMSEMRRNGGWELLNRLHNEKMNVQYLARWGQNVPFHFYLNKTTDRFDIKELRIRTTPIYKDVIDVLGGTPVTTAPGEVYTALERGVVDGYGWPIIGIFDLGWERVTKVRLDPGFYSVEINVLVNADTWKSLSDAQRKVLSDAALWLESLDQGHIAMAQQERDRQAQAGIKVVKASDSEASQFLSRVAEIGWASVSRRSPENATKLRPLMAD